MSLFPPPPPSIAYGTTTPQDAVTSIHSFLSNLTSQFHNLILELQLPTWQAYQEALHQFLYSFLALFQSLYQLLFLTLRPPLLLCFLFTKGLYRHACRPLLISFYQYERSLSPAQLATQLAVIILLLALYLLRRFLQRKRYFSRLALYIKRKRNLVVQKYRAALQKMAQTSLTLARIVPHAVYFGLIVSCWEVSPRGMILFWRTMAVETQLGALLGVWLPLGRTAYVLGKWKKYNIERKKKTRVEEQKKKRRMELEAEALAKKQVKEKEAAPGSSSALSSFRSLWSAKKSANTISEKSHTTSAATSKTSYSSPTSTKKAPQDKSPNTHRSIKSKSVMDRVARFDSGSAYQSTKSSSSSASTFSSSSFSSHSYNPTLNSTLIEGDEEEDELLFAAVDMLKYWMVYSLLLAALQFISMLPFVGRVLDAPTDLDVYQSYSYYYYDIDDNEENGWSLYTFFLSGILRRLGQWWTQRGYYAQEWKLILIVWVWLFHGLTRGGGASVAASSSSSSSGSKNAVVSYQRGGSKSSSTYGHANTTISVSPLDLLYDKMISFVRPFYGLVASSSGTNHAPFHHGHSQDTSSAPSNLVYSHKTGLTLVALSKLDSILQLAVLVRLLSESRKRSILRVLSDGTDYAPAVVTLVMPGYFCRWGCAYAGCIVPSGYGMQCCDTFATRRRLRLRGHQKRWNEKTTQDAEQEEDEEMRLDYQVARQLQYWVVYHALVHALLLSPASPMQGILRWTPFSTHLTLLVILSLQLLQVADRVYRGVEAELVAFGVLDVNCSSLGVVLLEKTWAVEEQGGKDGGGGDGKGDVVPDVKGTVTLRVLSKIIKSLPSAGSTVQEDGDAENGGDENGGGDEIKGGGEKPATEFAENADSKKEDKSSGDISKEKAKENSGKEKVGGGISKEPTKKKSTEKLPSQSILEQVTTENKSQTNNGTSDKKEEEKVQKETPTSSTERRVPQDRSATTPRTTQPNNAAKENISSDAKRRPLPQSMDRPPPQCKTPEVANRPKDNDTQEKTMKDTSKNDKQFSLDSVPPAAENLVDSSVLEKTGVENDGKTLVDESNGRESESSGPTEQEAAIES